MACLVALVAGLEGQSVAVEGIDCSFGSGIGLVAEAEVGYQEGGCSVVEFQRQCSEVCPQEFLVACLVVASRVVVEPLRQKRRRNRVHP
ncbi:MAG: hypothetical protein CMB70_03630 [Euryarchaeota archaeon]|nr:hypothetical protein [Euryarchaeota archaeon]